MSKHTEGPWELDKCRNLIQSSSKDGIAVRCCMSYPNYKHTEAEANAQLIAAAPALLEALEGLVDCISETRGTPAHNALLKARAAIAQARGESHNTQGGQS